ncbi:Uma2 family endonuclease [Lyngbya sp. CCY1209]|uniref:Uma2 family endonuclease n=1 Tax=Lyngbya sp. CCY1209 TaxID=2886103 RepID=UPI002D208B27|nr:Uma2 family endonuclease [Lyngbya sp. CCY1209]MEB3885628.1 Uma2 family endonuclease [Lyngbya sp. CCY1209]
MTPFPLTTLPPLENGDRLTRREFERRYAAMPRVTKAELIEGTVYMASPLHAKAHGKPHAQVVGWLIAYEAATPGVEALDNATVGLDTDNEPQPDALLRIETGGQSTISEEDYVEGAPELIVEIAASSASLDLNQKLQVYRRNGVREYLVWRTYDGAIDWFRWEDGQYVPLNVDGDGIVRSLVFPGLWLDKDALLAGDLARVLAILQQGIATSEHQTFIEQLSRTKIQ